ncbi:MAG: hypothetical protein C0417_00035 [Chlorobiaceae bacterium]|nr:hypothetical protein [Chlorobiaceae bacterium]
MATINLIIYIIVGGFIGVLINYLADVLPLTRKFTMPVCPNCSALHSLRSYLISFKCQQCGKFPSKRSLIVTSLSIIISILVALFPFGRLNFWFTVPLIVFLGLILVIDIEHRVVLIETSIAGLVLLFIYGVILQGFVNTFIGGVSGFLIMLFIYYFGIFFSKILGKIRKQKIDEVALGFGDVYVCGFLGFLTGWPFIIGTIVLAIITSGIFALLFVVIKLIRKEYQAFSAIPYTPFLILGAIAIFYVQ